MTKPGLLRSLFDIRPDERGIAALMCSYFFLVITSFWILKPLKKMLFIGHYADAGFQAFGFDLPAAQAELIAKVLNMVVAAVAVTIFSILARRLRRQELTYAFTGFFVVAYAIYAAVLAQPTGAVVWSFYLFGDLFSTLMVATFFAFLNDSVTPDAAKRLYGVIGFGGVAGGAFGSSAVAVGIEKLSIGGWLAVAGAIGGLIVVVAWRASRTLPAYASRGDMPGDAADADEGEPSSTGNPALAGARLVFKSRYLLSIVAIVGLYELVSTVLDYQFTASIVHFSADADARGQNFATVYAASNWLALVVQLFLTSLVMQRFGLVTALMVLPVAIGMASTGFVILPSLVLGGILSVADNGFSYSLNQSAKEALYVPASVEEKYHAKAFIDMFVQRFAKALGVGLSLLVGAYFQDIEGMRLLSYFLLPLLALWVFSALYAGRQFAALETSTARDQEG
jgi:AAA family ATP:ADP antiporter